ncbi:MAG: hypothetical protein JWO03_2039 [Bacteroidetes bacterium]|nr:hypothetical protein [Bacteroidota bacterium]
MKSIYTLVFLVVVSAQMVSAQTIGTSGYTYDPDSLAVHVGDQVTFNSTFSTHPLREVSAADWATSTTTQLAGGFSASSGTTLTVTMTAAGTRYYLCANHAGLGMKGRIFVTTPNGIQNIASVASATFPNPASNQLHIIVGKEGDMHSTLTDMIGNAVLTRDDHVSAQGVLTLDISNVADGAYILSTISADGISHTSRVQIVH